MQVPVYEWQIDQENPLTPEETENVLAEAEIHARIPKEKYQGQAEGMRDIAEQYGPNPFPFPRPTPKDQLVYHAHGDYLIEGVHPGPSPYLVFARVGERGKGKEVASGFSSVQDAVDWIDERMTAKQLSGRRYEPFKKNRSEDFGVDPGKDFYKSFLLSKERGKYYATDMAGKKHGPVKTLPGLKKEIDKFVARFTTGPRLNPPHVVGKIYERVLEVRASKAGMAHHCDAACKAANHRYKHPFKEKACVYALSDGSFLVK